MTMVRTSERMAYKECRWNWERAFVDRLKPVTAAPPLRFGTLIHKALEAYYPKGTKRGPHPAKTFAKLYAKELEEQVSMGFRDEDGTWHDAQALGIGMMEGYVDLYGKDSLYQVMVSEAAFEVPILNPRTGSVVAVYVGIMDGVWRNRETNELHIVDHKTAGSISVKHLPMDEQAGAYWTYGQDWIRQQGWLKPDQKLSGMLYNFMRKSLPNPDNTYNELGQKLNKDGAVSKVQPAPFFHREPTYRDEYDRNMIRQRVYEELREMHLVRQGKLAAYKNPGPQFRPNCAGCPYRDICELHEVGADWKEMAKQTMTVWDPYSEHSVRDGDQR